MKYEKESCYTRDSNTHRIMILPGLLATFLVNVAPVVLRLRSSSGRGCGSCRRLGRNRIIRRLGCSKQIHEVEVTPWGKES